MREIQVIQAADKWRPWKEKAWVLRFGVESWDIQCQWAQVCVQAERVSLGTVMTRACVCHGLLWARNSLLWMWTHSISRQPRSEPKAFVCCQAMRLLSASLRCSRHETRYRYSCQSAWHWAVTFSNFWDGNRLVNVNACIREWCESLLHFGGQTHRMFLHFPWTWWFSSRKNFCMWLSVSSGRTLA